MIDTLWYTNPQIVERELNNNKGTSERHKTDEKRQFWSARFFINIWFKIDKLAHYI